MDEAETLFGICMGTGVSLAFLVSCYGLWFKANELQNLFVEAFDNFPDRFGFRKFMQAYVQSWIFVWLGRIVTTIVVVRILQNIVWLLRP